eukprot:2090013-Pyramimonas_sp.AAC.1
MRTNDLMLESLAVVPKSYRFNHVVGIDLVEVECPLGDALHLLINIICWSISFQLSGHVGPGKSADVIWQAFVRAWARVFGMPEVVAVDPGTDFEVALADDLQNNG